MKKIDFISYSSQVQGIIKGLTLSKSLFISTILWGEPYTGKLTLVRSLFPKTNCVDGEDFQLVQKTLENNEELIIYNFDAISNIQSLDLENKRIIAIANYTQSPSSIENRFAFIYYMPPLRERLEDVNYFLTKFTEEMKLNLDVTQNIEIDFKYIDLSQNFHSFKTSLYKELVKKTLTKEDIELILFNYLYDEMEGKNAYREHLGLYERPLIRAGLKKFKSQLKLSEVLGLNRNTLRKKIHEHNID